MNNKFLYIFLFFLIIISFNFALVSALDIGAPSNVPFVDVSPVVAGNGSGTTGPPGPPGPQGPAGPAGANGTNGIDGLNGTNGVDGINGTNGINGTFNDILNSTQFRNVTTTWSINTTWLTNFVNALITIINPFDQVLNTTSNVTFNKVNASIFNGAWNGSSLYYLLSNPYGYYNSTSNIGNWTQNATGMAYMQNLSVSGTNISFWGQSRIRYNRSTNQNITMNGAYTSVVSWPNLIFDQQSEWNGTRFTPKNSGYYRVSAAVIFDSYSWNAGNYAMLSLFKKNVQYNRLARYESEVTGIRYVDLYGTDTVFLNTTNGDYLEFKVQGVRTAAAWANIYADGLYNYVAIEKFA